MLGRRDIDVNYDWTPHVGRYCNDDILRGDYWKQRKAESPSDLNVDHQPLDARDSLNRELRLQAPPCVIMMEFDKYSGSVFLTTADGRKMYRLCLWRGTFRRV